MQTTHHKNDLYPGYVCVCVCFKILKTLKKQRSQLKLGKRLKQIFFIGSSVGQK